MQVLDFEVGDTVYSYTCGGRRGKLTAGKVLLKCNLPGYRNMVFYIVEFPTVVDPLLEVLTGDLLSDTETGLVGFERKTFA